MLDGFAGNHRQVGGESIRFLATVSFHIAGDDITLGGKFTTSRFKHRIGLSHAGAHAEKYLEPPAFLQRRLPLDCSQQCLGIGALAVVHEIILTNRTLDVTMPLSKRSLGAHSLPIVFPGFPLKRS